ncbi:MAG: flagellar hook-length control protein FliK [Pseudolabrys sp.]
MFSTLVDSAAPPEKRDEPSRRSANSRNDSPAKQQSAPARDRGTGAANDKPASTDAGPDKAAGKTNGTEDAKAEAKATVEGAVEQAAADAGAGADNASTETKTDATADATPAAVVIPAATVVIPAPSLAPSVGDPTADATDADGNTVLTANPAAAGQIAPQPLKANQATGDAGKVQQTPASGSDPLAADAATDPEAGKPATMPVTAEGKPAENADAKPAAPAATPDDHPAVAHRAADAAANDPSVAKTDATPTPPTLHTAQQTHATAATAHTASTAATTPQPVPLHAVAMEIVARAGAGKNRFEIRLDPPELGKIDVRLDIDKHGQVTSRLIVEKAETLDLLRRDAPQLERALQDAGLKTSGDGLQFSLQQQMSQQRDDQPSGHVATAQMLVTDETAATDVAARSYASLAAARGGIANRV